MREKDKETAMPTYYIGSNGPSSNNYNLKFSIYPMIGLLINYSLQKR